MRLSRFAQAAVLSLAFTVSMTVGLGPTRTITGDFSSLTETKTHTATTAIAVTTTADELTVDGNCSLREAIQASNTDTAVDGCSPGNGDDMILLSAGIYALSIEGRSEDANAEGDLDITGVLTITGPSAATTIIEAGTDATNGIDRVLHVLSSSSLTLENVQICYGLASFGAAPHINGGGIYVADHSVLNVNNSTITHNWGANGGGITSASDTTVNINNSTISNNDSYSAGGGLASLGTVNIRNTTFNGNTGIFGGAIGCADGRVDIANSTFSENSALEFDWQPGYGAAGGAIYNGGELDLSNSTISGNTAINEGGGIVNSGTLHVRNSTFTNNSSWIGGSLVNSSGIVTVTNSIIAAKAGGDCSGAIVSNDFNIDSDSTCNLTQPHDQPHIDPLLQTLANNGGPTQTNALSLGSLAINTGNCSGGTITVDQRGMTRPQGNACDVGAYEYGASFANKAYLPIVRRDR
jgi:CSLREA domain-containing protein